jgi:phosphoribosylglycinamide formyltransferase 1
MNKQARVKRPLKLGFLASHNGTDMQGIVDAIEKGELKCSAVVVISNNSKSNTLEFAKEIKIPAYHISKNVYGTEDKTDEAIATTLLAHDVDLVVLSGYMKRIGSRTRQAFPNRILNVHPSLLPKYAGLWGDAVHQAVLDAGDTISGVTIHTIDEEYDAGKILWQSEVPVHPNDAVEQLRKRVQREEINSYIQVLQSIQNGNLIL